jgi:hypothetical protein
VIDGGIVLDLSEMKGFEIDVAGRTTWDHSRKHSYVACFARTQGASRSEEYERTSKRHSHTGG